ncbi:cytochrome P450 [Streptomyces sp. NPDC057474]|uniref:cytochrome P450 n=1 Tax=Streptomyces sp. NPDC057474 TaxID=3346144 RepID=UPI0036BAE2C8
MKASKTLERELESLSFADLEHDPYPLYERLRSEAPVAYVPAAGGWLATGYETVKAIHEDTERFAAVFPPEPLECIGEHNILSVDGPQHRRYRKALHACLARPVVDTYTDAVIRDVVERRLWQLDDRSTAELVSEYFEPISVLSLGRVIGIPEVSADTLRHWFRGIILASSNLNGDMNVAREAHTISREIDAEMSEVFQRLDQAPNDTIVSHLLRHAVGDSLDERVHDITPTLKIVIGGGLQEPGHGASTLAAALLMDERLRARFAADPEAVVRPAIEEALRWVSPIQVNVRRTLADVEIEGQHLPADTFVNASVGAANRAHEVFGADAAVFDIDRRAGQHLAFGSGMHFCSGNYFGRVAIRFAVQRLFERYPDLRLDPSHHEPSFRGFVFRAPEALHVALGDPRTT